ncbi:hypothetical protein CANARDRAFT_190094, partial [[Candida] arabinofermentans NRRL YB-2248]
KEFNEAKPWKHHSDAVIVSEDEKKRYEGIWAANKGENNNGESAPPAMVKKLSTSILEHKSNQSQKVHGLIVREIWRRSRLSDETLCKIWNLQVGDKNVLDVDDGLLTKEEFLVGTWLVDQCLYGKKLPKTINEDVWESVETTAGINIHP